MYRQDRNYENLEKRIFEGTGQYDIPELDPETFGPCDLIGFNEAKTASDPENLAVHFFIDDYQFMRVWRNPGRYAAMLKKFRYVLAPDFSLYTDFPKAVQIFNHYRKHWIGRYFQDCGIHVIPTIGWSDPESFAWCFDGEPIQSWVAISSVGSLSSRAAKEAFLAGYHEMIDRLEPVGIIFYGDVPDECRTGPPIVQFDPFHKRLRRIN